MDSCQGGSDGVSTDGILTPALPIGILQSVCMCVTGQCVWLGDKESAQMD